MMDLGTISAKRKEEEEKVAIFACIITNIKVKK